MSTPDNVLKAYEMANDYAKQLLTLSTGIIGITVALSKDLLSTTGVRTALLKASLGLYLVSILAGIMHMEVLVGTMGLKDAPTAGPEGCLEAMVQTVTFALATAVVIASGFARPPSEAKPRKPRRSKLEPLAKLRTLAARARTPRSRLRFPGSTTGSTRQ